MKSVVCVLLGGCTVLGPMPATTGVGAVPAGKTGVDGQLGFVPASFLSASASHQKANGDATLQLAALVEVGETGVIAGGRIYGVKGDTAAEPMVGYRKKLDDQFSVAAIAFGTHESGTAMEKNSTEHATYRATLGGVELAANGRMFEPAHWLSIDVQVAAQATAISARGTYCVDATGIAVDCETGQPDVNGHVLGIYPAGSGTIALDLHGNGWARTLRLGLMGAVGRMPRLLDGHQQWGTTFASWGLVLTLGAGQ